MEEEGEAGGVSHSFCPCGFSPETRQNPHTPLPTASVISSPEKLLGLNLSFSVLLPRWPHVLGPLMPAGASSGGQWGLGLAEQ